MSLSRNYFPKSSVRLSEAVWQGILTKRRQPEILNPPSYSIDSNVLAIALSSAGNKREGGSIQV